MMPTSSRSCFLVTSLLDFPESLVTASIITIHAHRYKSSFTHTTSSAPTCRFAVATFDQATHCSMSEYFDYHPNHEFVTLLPEGTTVF